MAFNDQSASVAFRERIADASFPCVGAKAALAQDYISFEVSGDLRDPHDDVALVAALQKFMRNAGNDDVFPSKVLLFPATPMLDETAFEQALWQRLQWLHPVDAMRFEWDSQFEALRADGRYERLRDIVIQRDVAYVGSCNPMLAIHGEKSEVRQYSGRQVEAEWRCPFSSDTGCSDAA